MAHGQHLCRFYDDDDVQISFEHGGKGGQNVSLSVLLFFFS